jgi:hypothetical protein
VIDRDGFRIRNLRQNQSVKKGPGSVEWDGKDDQGRVVPDEAYSFRVLLLSERSKREYFPAKDFQPVRLTPQFLGYSRSQGTISYRLPANARVHLQVGQAVVNPKSHETEGPVLLNIVDRDPRVAGSIIETWDGFDRSKQVFIPDLPHFSFNILATSLPENSVITVGNKKELFRQYSERTRILNNRVRLIGKGKASKGHVGLDAGEDHSPTILVEQLERHFNDAALEMKIRITVANEDQDFLSQPNQLFVFWDETPVFVRNSSKSPCDVSFKVPGPFKGQHHLAVNWISRFGPSGVAVAPIADESGHVESRQGRP